ncbi:MAG: ribosome small subunit-dependent GTPase A, partial [Gammaproteobacteria bacterium]|nr:ribosome small subunit-dependent GTPase A [Gammaproteobacteria bacterium]
MNNPYSLSQLGWKHFFQQQLSLEEWEANTLARVVGVERSVIHLLTTAGKQSLTVTTHMPAIAVGDWLLLDEQGRFHRLLDRNSLFSRKAAGTKVSTQLIAANVDTVFIVSSLNQDFNLNRFERYLALANETGVTPVIVLTRLDLCDHPEDYLAKLHALDPSLAVVMVNSLDPQSVEQLKAWCTTGETVALLGSSGVGKSTIINSLLGSNIQSTQSIREDDDKGRHTTTQRSIHFLPSGGLLLDTPGMRELQIAACEHGIDETFSEIVELATGCKFSDC